MAKKKGPMDFFSLRRLLHDEKASSGARSACADVLRGDGQVDRAVEFYHRAGDTEKLEEIVRESAEKGDAFTFEAALTALGRTATREEWTTLGERAREKGLLWFAYRGFEKADSQEGLQRVREEMKAAGVFVESE